MSILLYQKLLFGTEPYFISAGNGAAFELHRHAEIEICFCLKGGHRFVAGGKTVEVKENDLAIIGSLIPHEYLGCTSPDCKTILLEVGPALLRDYFEPMAGGCKDFRIFSLASEDSPIYKELRTLLQDISSAYLERPPMSDFIIRGDIYKICALLLRLLLEDNTTPIGSASFRDVGKVEKALEIIYNRYNEPLDIDTVSSACGYSKSNFCKTFKAVTGETFHNLLNRHRVEIACVLLKETGHSIEQISSEVGFSDTKSFCRVFKTIIGESAGSYRKKL